MRYYNLAKTRKYLPAIAIISASLLSIIGIYLAINMLTPGVDDGKVLQSDVTSRLLASHSH